MRVTADGSVEIWSPAKINLTLDILGRRANGFHELETCMVQIGWYDTLRMTRQENDPSIRLTIEDHRPHTTAPAGSAARTDPIPTDDRNLIVRAIGALRTQCVPPGSPHDTEDANLPEMLSCGMHVHLTKRIASQAGLGGGSSNAAAALLGANRVWQLGQTPQSLMPIAATLGSDVPFFLGDSPAICSGRGEVCTPCHRIPRTHLVVILPPVGLATADVFQHFAQGEPPGRARPDMPTSLLPHQWNDWMRNDLQIAASELSPWITRMRSVCDRMGFLAHQMSGSGTAYFGVCRNAVHARHIAGRLGNRGLGTVRRVSSQHVIL